MKERPILFSSVMVRALLAGIKTQTRRIVKPQPGTGVNPYAATVDPFNRVLEASGHGTGDSFPCPYGQPGDRLWVKETFRFTTNFDGDSPVRVGERNLDAGHHRPSAPIQYDADGERRNWQCVGTPPSQDATSGKTRVSIHMPRWASRITLEIVTVRVERLQDISEMDAWAEGITEAKAALSDEPEPSARGAYKVLWDSINGAGSWEANPFVWCIEFKRMGQGAEQSIRSSSARAGTGRLDAGAKRT